MHKKTFLNVIRREIVIVVVSAFLIRILVLYCVGCAHFSMTTHFTSELLSPTPTILRSPSSHTNDSSYASPILATSSAVFDTSVFSNVSPCAAKAHLNCKFDAFVWFG
jgi:hypothetical protein